VIYKHPKEKDQKSTAWPLQFLSNGISMKQSYLSVEKKLSTYSTYAILYPGDGAVQHTINK